jgi:hypothetical protein
MGFTAGIIIIPGIIAYAVTSITSRKGFGVPRGTYGSTALGIFHQRIG